MPALMNEDIIRKSAIAVQDLADNAGYLRPANARRFLRLAVPDTTLLRMARFHAMQTPEESIDKIRFGSRVLRAGTTAKALTEPEWAKPDLWMEVMKARLFKAEIDMDMSVLEDNIERQGFLQTVLDGASGRVGVDIEEVVVNGDTNNAVDKFLATLDGIMKQASALIYNHMGAPVDLGMWTKMVKLMPPEFQRSMMQMRWFTPFNLQHDWRANMAGRMGALGDAMIQGLDEVKAYGIPLVPVANMRDDKTYNGLANHGDVLLTPPKNIVVGIYSGIRMMLDFSVKDGIWTIVIRLRMDAKLVERTAAVKGINILLGETSQRVGGSSTVKLVPDDPVALSELGYTTLDNNMQGFSDNITPFAPDSSDLGLVAPQKFVP